MFACADLDVGMIGGGTRSTSADTSSIVRPCMPEIVPLLERANSGLRGLGMVPARNPQIDLEHGTVLLMRDVFGGQEYNIGLHPGQQRFLEDWTGQRP
jgi:hypothetical protein